MPTNEEETEEKGSAKERTRKKKETTERRPPSEACSCQTISEVSVKIDVPGAELTEIQVGSMEIVQEMHQLLLDQATSCHRTCFSLRLNGRRLDNYAELKTITDLTSGCVLKISEEWYTTRDAKLHVRHIRDLLRSLHPADQYSCNDNMSPSFLCLFAGSDGGQALPNGRRDDGNVLPAEHLLPGSTERPLLGLHPTAASYKPLQCIKVLSYSPWNPPPSQRRLHGDLIYIYALTMEGRKFHITCCPRGWYVNCTQGETFDPKPNADYHLHHSLIYLLKEISPIFRKNWAQLLRQRSDRHPFERMPAPQPVYPWLSPVFAHSMDYIRTEDAHALRAGLEDSMPSIVRDWNEELQLARELPKTTPQERLLRERALFKVQCEFVMTALRGAVSVVNGCIMPLNPGEELRHQMFLWNNIFFSLCNDVKDHYKPLGGDIAAHVAAKMDMRGVQLYTSAEVSGLHTVGVVIVDYCGMRIAAQTILPGMLEKEQEQLVEHGTMDLSKDIVVSDKFTELLAATESTVKIRRHKMIDHNGNVFEFNCSADSKGITGNDRRQYLLDLYTCFAPDVNFLPEAKDDLDGALKSEGFPLKHPHRLVSLRAELVAAFIESRYMAFVRSVTMQMQTLLEQKRLAQTDSNAATGANAKVIDAGDGDSKKVDEAVEEANAESATNAAATAEVEPSQLKTANGPDAAVLRKACAEVGSLSDDSFDFFFNPDLYRCDLKHAEPDPAESGPSLQRQKQLLAEMASAVVLGSIPTLIRDLQENNVMAPMDSSSLTNLLHTRGINLRYLGYLVKKLAELDKNSAVDTTADSGIETINVSAAGAESSSQHHLRFVQSLCISEMLCRSTKAVFNRYMHQVSPMHRCVAIAHFLNCFLDTFPSATAYLLSSVDMKLRVARRKGAGTRKRPHNSGGGSHSAKDYNAGTNMSPTEHLEWSTESAKTIWNAVVGRVFSHFGYRLDCENMLELLEKYSLQRVSMLRTFCLQNGIQLHLRNYPMVTNALPSANSSPSSKSAVFTADDIINVFPVLKMPEQRSPELYKLWEMGQQKVQQGCIREGYDMVILLARLVAEALNQLNAVFGTLHPDVAACLRMMARLTYIIGDHAEALQFQFKATIISERCHGVDNPQNVEDYSSLALYYFATERVGTALRLMYHARYLLLISCGEWHPAVANVDQNIGLMLHATDRFELSLKFLLKALDINKYCSGATALKVALNYHLVARTYSCMGEFRKALQYEKEAFNIYRNSLGDSHDRTRESSTCLRHLTQQAVTLERTLVELRRSTHPNKTIPPLEIQTPSPSRILDTLNLINGIIIFTLSEEEVEKLKELTQTMPIFVQPTAGSVAQTLSSPEGLTSPASTLANSGLTTSANAFAETPTSPVSSSTELGHEGLENGSAVVVSTGDNDLVREGARESADSATTQVSEDSAIQMTNSSYNSDAGTTQPSSPNGHISEGELAAESGANAKQTSLGAPTQLVQEELD